MSERVASVERTTSETHISCTIDLDHIPGVTEQKINVSTGIGFLDHVRVSNLPPHKHVLLWFASCQKEKGRKLIG